MKVRDTIEKQLQCQYFVPGKSVTQPSMALDVHTIVTNFARPAWQEFADLNPINENQDFTSLVPEDFDDISEIMPFLANGKRMVDACAQAYSRAASVTKNVEPDKDSE